MPRLSTHPCAVLRCAVVQTKQAEQALLQQQVERSKVGKEDSVSGRGRSAVGALCPLRDTTRPRPHLASLRHSALCWVACLSASLPASACLPASTALCLLGLPPVMQDERRQLLQQVQQLQAEVEAQQQELAQYAGNDPERYDAISERQLAAACMQPLGHAMWPRRAACVTCIGKYRPDASKALQQTGKGRPNLTATQVVVHVRSAHAPALQSRQRQLPASRPTGGLTTPRRCGCGAAGPAAGHPACRTGAQLAGKPVLPWQPRAWVRRQRAWQPATRPAARGRSSWRTVLSAPASLQDWLKKRFDGMGEQIDGLFKEVR